MGICAFQVVLDLHQGLSRHYGNRNFHIESYLLLLKIVNNFSISIVRNIRSKKPVTSN